MAQLRGELSEAKARLRALEIAWTGLKQDYDKAQLDLKEAEQADRGECGCDLCDCFGQGHCQLPEDQQADPEDI